MTTLLRAAPLALAMPLTACTLSESVNLTDYGVQQLEIIFDAAAPQAGVTVYLLRPTHGDSCGALEEDIRATVNGVELDLLVAGGRQLVRDGTVCTNAAFAGPATADEDGRLVVRLEDATATIEARIENAGTMRRLETEADLMRLEAGETVRFAWTPPEDELFRDRVDIAMLTPAAGGAAPNVVPSAVVVDAGIELTLPADAPAGDYDLFVNHFGQAGLVECTGVASCSVMVEATVEAPLRIVD